MSGPDLQRQDRQAGFSLVELMVVISLIALVSTLVLLNAGAASPGLDREADQFASRLSAARDMALIENRPVALAITAEGYEPQMQTRQGWAPPHGQRDLILWQAGTSASISGATLPTLLAFDSIGLAEPAEITLYRDGRTQTVRLTGAGQIDRQIAGETPGAQ